jgi:hypothetical protein
MASTLTELANGVTVYPVTDDARIENNVSVTAEPSYRRWIV